MTPLAALLALATLLLSPLGTAAAASTPAPVLGKYTDTLSFHVTHVDPLIAGPDNDLLTVVAEVANTGPDPVVDMSYRFQRGDALTSAADLREELSKPSQPVAVINSPFTDLDGELDPGATRTVVFQVPLAGDPKSTLAVTEPGVYPVMVNVNGTVHTEAGDARARIGELHLTLPVAAPPGGSASSAVGLHVIWPIASTPHLAVDGVFRTDDLAVEISPGGRLDTVLSALEAAPTADFVTLAVDPMLLDELDRMSRGYWVLDDKEITQQSLTPEAAEAGPPETSESPETPDGTSAPAAPPQPEHTVAGTGSAQAISFLARLKQLVAEHPTIVLPYGDTDVTALARAGQDQAIATAVLRGRGVASRVLGQSVTSNGVNPDGSVSTLITSVALPPGGAITSSAWSELASLGYSSLVLDPSGVKSRTARGSVLVTGLDRSGGAAAVPALVTGPNKTVTDLLLSGTPASWQEDLPELAATLTLDPPTADIAVLPARDFRPSPDGLATLTELTADLTSAGILLPPADFRHIAANSGPFGGYMTKIEGDVTEVASRYPDSARKQELPAAYLNQLKTLRADLVVMSTSLGQGDGGPDPADILTPLAEILLPATSASLRGVAKPFSHNLATATDTITALYDGVTVQRDTGRYTLASTTAPLILTLRNTLPYQVTVTLSIERGAQLGLKAADPGQIVIDAGPRTAGVKIDTTVTRSGTFVVDAQLRDRYGAAWGPAVPLTIDSRAYGPLTIILMISAGGVLVLMVIWRLVQRIRGKTGVPDDALAPTEPEGPDDDTHDDPASPQSSEAGSA